MSYHFRVIAIFGFAPSSAMPQLPLLIMTSLKYRWMKLIKKWQVCICSYLILYFSYQQMQTCHFLISLIHLYFINKCPKSISYFRAFISCSQVHRPHHGRDKCRSFYTKQVASPCHVFAAHSISSKYPPAAATHSSARRRAWPVCAKFACLTQKIPRFDLPKFTLACRPVCIHRFFQNIFFDLALILHYRVSRNWLALLSPAISRKQNA